MAPQKQPQEHTFDEFLALLYEGEFDDDARYEVPGCNPELPALEGQEWILHEADTQTILFGTVKRLPETQALGLGFPGGGFLDFQSVSILTIDREQHLLTASFRG